jgi:hypothetical protein
MMHRYINFIGAQFHERDLNFYTVDMIKSKFAETYATLYKITRFPAFLIVVNGHPIKILIGASIYKLFDLIKMIKTDKSIKMCPTGHHMIEIRPNTYVNWRCSECSRERRQSN